MHDVIIVGGSYAGISAAFMLGRARRSVLVLDAGQRRNRFAESSHGFLGQDGESPAAIAEKGKREVLAYPTVTWEETFVKSVERTAEGFVLDGTYHGKRLVLATGVVDELPAIPGLSDRWGKSVFVCPYCHGYELDRGDLGVLATNPMSAHHAMMVSDWGRTTTFFLTGAAEPKEEELALLAKRNIVIERTPVSSVDGAITVHLADGRAVPLAGLFLGTRIRFAAPLAEQLGCTLDEGPFGPILKVDPMKQTSVPNVFACGDAAAMMNSVAIAVADGAMAGAAAHRSLIFG